jgi:hypothetical protein
MTARVEVVHERDCPLVDQAVERVRFYRSTSGTDAVIVVREGELASPTVLVDGLDVVTGRPPVATVACRLDLPTDDQIRLALERSQT